MSTTLRLLLLTLCLIGFRAEVSFGQIYLDTTAYPKISGTFTLYDDNGLYVQPNNARIVDQNGNIYYPILDSCPTALPKISLAVSIDVSNSMGVDSSVISPAHYVGRDAARIFSMGNGEGMLDEFDTRLVFIDSFTTNFQKLTSDVSKIPNGGGNDFEAQLFGPTGIFTFAKAGKYQRIVLLLTDGLWTEMADSNVAKAIYICRRDSITFYPVYYSVRDTSWKWTYMKKSLTKISLGSGGHPFDSITSENYDFNFLRQFSKYAYGDRHCHFYFTLKPTCDSVYTLHFFYDTVERVQTFRNPTYKPYSKKFTITNNGISRYYCDTSHEIISISNLDTCNRPVNIVAINGVKTNKSITANGTISVVLPQLPVGVHKDTIILSTPDSSFSVLFQDTVYAKQGTIVFQNNRVDLFDTINAKECVDIEQWYPIRDTSCLTIKSLRFIGTKYGVVLDGNVGFKLTPTLRSELIVLPYEIKTEWTTDTIYLHVNIQTKIVESIATQDTFYFHSIDCDSVIEDIPVINSGCYAKAVKIGDTTVSIASNGFFIYHIVIPPKANGLDSVIVSWNELDSTFQKTVYARINPSKGFQMFTVRVLNFDTLSLCSDGTAYAIIHNTGCNTLTLTDLHLSNGKFLLMDSGRVIAPHDSEIIRIVFQPTYYSEEERTFLVISSTDFSASEELWAYVKPPNIIPLYLKKTYLGNNLWAISGVMGKSASVSDITEMLHSDKSSLVFKSVIADTGVLVNYNVTDSTVWLDIKMPYVTVLPAGTVLFTAYVQFYLNEKDTTASIKSDTLIANTKSPYLECVEMWNGKSSVPIVFDQVCGSGLIRNLLQNMPAISINPNPADHSITVTSSDAALYNIDVVDIGGRIVLNGSTNTKISTLEVPSGVYFVVIHIDNIQIIRKFKCQH